MNAEKTWLVVGAGAIGQPYGLALAEAGGKVAFLARRGARKPAAARFLLRDDRSGREKTLEAPWLSEIPPAENLRGILLCTRSDQLDGALEDFSAAIAARKGVPLFFFTLAFHDREKIAEACPGVPLVLGNASIISHLEGERVRYWLPPMPTFISPLSPGALPGARDLARAMRKGGVRAMVVKKSPAPAYYALSMPMLAALRKSRLSPGARDLYRLAAEAGKEGIVIHRRVFQSTPFGMGALRFIPASPAAQVVSGILGFMSDPARARYFALADKLGEQTVGMIDELIGDGKEAGLPTEKLEAIRGMV
ncbi:MAG: 2-dehydropantoate 2-reductase N-terminal domain-containing protein [Bdellovibrionota bacterium]